MIRFIIFYWIVLNWRRQIGSLLETYLVILIFIIVQCFATKSHLKNFLDEEFLEVMKTEIMPCLQATLEKNKKKHLLRWWCTIVKLLGTHLHDGLPLINVVMKVQ